MRSVEECKTARQLNDFFALSVPMGYAKKEAEYLRRFAHPAVNALSGNGPMAFLIARDGDAVAGRLMTFRDERYIAATGRNRGFFSLFEAKEEASARALLRRAREIQRAWGSEELFGPVSPNGSGFFLGLCAEEAGAVLAGHPSPAAKGALEEAGFCEEGAYLSYIIDVPAVNPLQALAERVERRFGVAVESFGGLLGKRRLERRVSEVCPAEKRADLMRELGHLLPLVSGEFSLAAVKDGACVGYLLALSTPGMPLRIATLETKKGAYTPAVAAALMSEICVRCREKGIQKVNASVIDEGNFASRRLAERFNIEKNCKFSRYIQKIKMI